VGKGQDEVDEDDKTQGKDGGVQSDKKNLYKMVGDSENDSEIDDDVDEEVEAGGDDNDDEEMNEIIDGEGDVDDEDDEADNGEEEEEEEDDEDEEEDDEESAFEEDLQEVFCQGVGIEKKNLMAKGDETVKEDVNKIAMATETHVVRTAEAAKVAMAAKVAANESQEAQVFKTLMAKKSTNSTQNEKRINFKESKKKVAGQETIDKTTTKTTTQNVSKDGTVAMVVQPVQRGKMHNATVCSKDKTASAVERTLPAASIGKSTVSVTASTASMSSTTCTAPVSTANGVVKVNPLEKQRKKNLKMKITGAAEDVTDKMHLVHKAKKSKKSDMKESEKIAADTLQVPEKSIAIVSSSSNVIAVAGAVPGAVALSVHNPTQKKTAGTKNTNAVGRVAKSNPTTTPDAQSKTEGKMMKMVEIDNTHSVVGEQVQVLVMQHNTKVVLTVDEKIAVLLARNEKRKECKRIWRKKNSAATVAAIASVAAATALAAANSGAMSDSNDVVDDADVLMKSSDVPRTPSKNESTDIKTDMAVIRSEHAALLRKRKRLAEDIESLNALVAAKKATRLHAELVNSQAEKMHEETDDEKEDVYDNEEKHSEHADPKKHELLLSE